jgi:hypothetical protein
LDDVAIRVSEVFGLPFAGFSVTTWGRSRK